MTSLYFALSCIGEGNGNTLQCSCLENPGDGGAWWAAVYVVAQSQTRLKQLSSSSQQCYIRVPVLPRPYVQPSTAQTIGCNGCRISIFITFILSNNNV